MTDQEILDSGLNRITTRFVHRIETDETELKAYKGLLYHYTTPEGLLGIMKSQKLWATEAAYLNDSREINYGLDVIHETLEEELSFDRPWLKEFIQSVRTHMAKERNHDVYVACFCENGDLLSQWKGYSKQGEGYAIGFASDKLSKYQRKHPFFGIKFRPVIYSRTEQKRIVATECEAIFEMTDEIHTLIRDLPTFVTGKMQEKLLHVASRYLADLLIYEAVQFKADAFSEEREWRAVYSNSPMNRVARNDEMKEHLKFRVAGNLIVPYLEMDIAPSAQKTKWHLPVTDIIVGAKINVDKARRSLEMLCTQVGCEIPAITPSGITLQ